ncbi:MAG TPA: hypothetical protein VFW62_06700, partial [bacterium]|nr:hypothetical protein [bacterium]
MAGSSRIVFPKSVITLPYFKNAFLIFSLTQNQETAASDDSGINAKATQGRGSWQVFVQINDLLFVMKS